MAFDQLLGGPGWLHTDRFDVAAKAGADVPLPQLRVMLRSLLEDRFKLVVRQQQREMPRFTLVLARTDGRLGPGLQKVDDCAKAIAAQPSPPAMPAGGAGSTGCGPLLMLVNIASAQLGAAVVDQTGLTGDFMMSLFYARDDARPAPGMAPPTSDTPPVSPNLPSLSAAFEEQLGLRLRAGRGPTDVIVIESVQPPTEN